METSLLRTTLAHSHARGDVAARPQIELLVHLASGLGICIFDVLGFGLLAAIFVGLLLAPASLGLNGRSISSPSTKQPKTCHLA